MLGLNISNLGSAVFSWLSSLQVYDLHTQQCCLVGHVHVLNLCISPSPISVLKNGTLGYPTLRPITGTLQKDANIDIPSRILPIPWMNISPYIPVKYPEWYLDISHNITIYYIRYPMWYAMCDLIGCDRSLLVKTAMNWACHPYSDTAKTIHRWLVASPSY